MRELLGSALVGRQIVADGRASALLYSTCHVHQTILSDLRLIVLFQSARRGWVDGDRLGRAARVPRLLVDNASYWLLVDKFNVLSLHAVSVREVSQNLLLGLGEVVLLVCT